MGFLLPAYAFQTSGRVCRWNEQFSIRQEMVPRNIYPGLSLPLVFAIFSKDARRTLVGFALYRDVNEVKGMLKPFREIVEQAVGGRSGSILASAR